MVGKKYSSHVSPYFNKTLTLTNKACPSSASSSSGPNSPIRLSIATSNNRLQNEETEVEYNSITIPSTFIRAYLSRPILIQEQLAQNPWRLLVATILLNKTTGKAAIPVFWKLMSLWPTPMKMALAPHGKMTAILSPLGFGVARALWLTKFSLAYELTPPVHGVLHKSRAKNFKAGDYPPTEISHLPNMGKYALDSYRCFCCDNEESGGLSLREGSHLNLDSNSNSNSGSHEKEWMKVRPTDKELIRYLKWKWAFLFQVEWSPIHGVVGPLPPERFEDLCEGRW